MSMQYCLYCDKDIDTDLYPDHFNVPDDLGIECVKEYNDAYNDGEE